MKLPETLKLFYKKITPQTAEEAKDKPISMFGDSPNSNEPLLDITIDTLDVNDTDELMDTIDKITGIQQDNRQLMPFGTDLVEFEIGTQLVFYLAKLKGHKPNGRDNSKLVEAFEKLLA